MERKNLLRQGDSVLIAVSGGLDSMVLLHLLHELSKMHGWKISIAHFNHQLRGRSSVADERLVQKTARQLKMKFVVERADVKKFAKENRLSVEMAARKLRHAFLARTAKRLRIKTIALGHHADDQVELFFLRLLRGAGTEGLAGMNWKSKSSADSSIELIRPLLNQSKEVLREYAKAEKIPFREDASNASLDFQRNHIRHEVVPLLKKIQPGANETILRTMEIAAWESNFVLGAALDWLSSKKRTPFDQLHIAVQRVCVRLQVRVLGFAATFDLVEQLRTEANRVIVISSTSSIYRNDKGIVCPRIEKAISFNATEAKIDLTRQNEIEFGGRRISCAFSNEKGVSLRRAPNTEFFDAQKVGSKIVLRHWKSGDRFQQIGTKSPKKLQDLFTDLKVPRAERHRRIVAVTERGEVFWVEGLRISECFKLDNQSRQRLKWTWQPV